MDVTADPLAGVSADQLQSNTTRREAAHVEETQHDRAAALADRAARWAGRSSGRRHAAAVFQRGQESMTQSELDKAGGNKASLGVDIGKGGERLVGMRASRANLQNKPVYAKVTSSRPEIALPGEAETILRHSQGNRRYPPIPATRASSPPFSSAWQITPGIRRYPSDGGQPTNPARSG